MASLPSISVDDPCFPTHFCSHSFGPFGNDILVGYGETLYSVSTEDGFIFWSQRLRGNIQAAPAVSGRRIFIGTTRAVFYGLKASEDNSRVTEVRPRQGDVLCAFGCLGLLPTLPRSIMVPVWHAHRTGARCGGRGR